MRFGTKILKFRSPFARLVLVKNYVGEFTIIANKLLI